MAATVARSPGTVTRNRFMIAVLSAIGTVIGLVYVGVLLRYLYPKSTSTPPLNVKIGPDGVTDPGTGQPLPYQNGVAGPFYYPMTADRSVVVGVFVEKIAANGPIAADNLRIVEQTCTHLGCPVAWVAADNRFECPCHGSQFHRDLSVAHGPANDPLHQHDFTLAGDNLTIKGRK